MGSVVNFLIIITMLTTFWRTNTNSVTITKLKTISTLADDCIIAMDKSNIVYGDMNENGELLLSNANINIEETIQLNKDPIYIFSGLLDGNNGGILYKDSIILFDDENAELISYNLSNAEVNWSNQILENRISKFINHMRPALLKNMLYINTDQGLLVINADSGITEYKPKGDIKNCYGTNYIYNNYLVSDNDNFSVVCYNLQTKKRVWRIGSIKGKDGRGPAYDINNSIFFNNNSCYVQYNAYDTDNQKGSFVLEINLNTGSITNSYNSFFSSGIWVEDNIAYIFPNENNSDCCLLKFNLSDKSFSTFPIECYYRPLGVCNGNVFYCSKDSIYIYDKNGVMVDKTNVGFVEYNNCKMYDDIISLIHDKSMSIYNVSQN